MPDDPAPSRASEAIRPIAPGLARRDRSLIAFHGGWPAAMSAASIAREGLGTD